jgi:hypothetical protein
MCTKVIFEEDSQTISRVIQLCEFKKFFNRNGKAPISANTSFSQNAWAASSQQSSSVKPLLQADLTSNSDIRFMDVCLFKADTTNEFIMCFACSDGLVRIFRLVLDTSRLYLINKFVHSKCLLCLRRLVVRGLTFLLGVGTDGCLLIWRLSLTAAAVEDSETAVQKIEMINQSGISDVTVWQVGGGEENGELVVATVGDDTRVAVLGLEFSEEGVCRVKYSIKHDMAHASFIVGMKQLLI